MQFGDWSSDVCSSDLNLLSGGDNFLPSLTKSRVIEGAVPLALLCPSLTELDIIVSERQDFSLVMDVIALVGKRLTHLRCQRSLYYGSDAIVQRLSSLAEATPNLQVLDILEHFCGGWGNPPCAQVNNLQNTITPLTYLPSSPSTSPIWTPWSSMGGGQNLERSPGHHTCPVMIISYTGKGQTSATVSSSRYRPWSA